MLSAMRLALFALVLLALPLPALGQFYDLDGAYRCITAPDEACQKNLRDQPRTPPAPPAEAPTLEKVIAKVRDKTAGPGEIDFLEKHAAANEPRAVEVLAWCRLNGIGGAADPLAAYWLYRQAAKLGVANARSNQIAVYESRLTPDERQQVLVQENAQ
jgi:TPR repeat protein